MAKVRLAITKPYSYRPDIDEKRASRTIGIVDNCGDIWREDDEGFAMFTNDGLIILNRRSLLSNLKHKIIKVLTGI